MTKFIQVALLLSVICGCVNADDFIELRYVGAVNKPPQVTRFEVGDSAVREEVLHTETGRLETRVTIRVEKVAYLQLVEAFEAVPVRKLSGPKIIVIHTNATREVSIPQTVEIVRSTLQLIASVETREYIQTFANGLEASKRFNDEMQSSQDSELPGDRSKT